MEKLVNDLKKIMVFKDTLEVGDIVLVVARKPEMLVYGLVNGIIRDDTKRDEWWHVSMHLLTLPPRNISWILRTEQMTGREIFTMDGEERFMKAVDFKSGGTTLMDDHRQDKKEKPSLRRIK